MPVILSLPLIVILSILSGCGTTKTIFFADFDTDVIGSSPSITQANGTVRSESGSGFIRVVPSPSDSDTQQKWVEISHLTIGAAETSLVGQFSKFEGLGEYGFLALLHIPSSADIVTVQFETGGISPQPNVSFLHLDFMPEGDVRINDDSNQRFGSYPRDEPFIVSANLDIDSGPSSLADISLSGGANGTATTALPSSIAGFFGQIRFWVGFQQSASFFVDSILVTKKD